MKYVQWALVVIGTLLLVAVVVGVLLPSRYEVRRTVHIDAPPDKVYDLVGCSSADDNGEFPAVGPLVLFTVVVEMM